MAIYYSTSLDRTFHALGDPSRRQILGTLIEKGNCSAGELAKLFNSAQPTVSKHLMVMEKAGLVKRSIKGRHHFFSIQTKRLQEADDWLKRHIAFWSNSLGQLNDYLNKNTSQPFTKKATKKATNRTRQGNK